MVDYSKFDSIKYDSEDDDGAPTILSKEIPSKPLETPAPQTLAKKGKEGRIRFEYEGVTVYEWEQSLIEVNLYIEPPQGVTRKMISIKISPHHLIVGLIGAPPFIDEDTGGPIIANESMWTFVDGEININLQKMNKAETWLSALKGRAGSQLDSYTHEQERKKMMLERFQEEHPGFDFSGAEFNGQVPEARDFMGGVKHF